MSEAPFHALAVDGLPADTPVAVAAAQRDRTAREMVGAAVAAGAVTLAYQPVAQAGRSGVLFHEGLARIHDAAGQLVTAGAFIDAVETTETGRRLDSLALTAGLSALAEDPDLRLSVNMSARSIGYHHWVDVLTQALARDARIGERLILEITESSAIVMPDVVQAFMSDLHLHGITFALDDFGAGYSSFRYLRDLSFDIVKIDGSFVQGVDSRADNQVLTRSLITVGAQFGMLTVAEQVATPAEAAWLTAAGIDGLQGHHIAPARTAPPRPAEPALA